ncbi:MAG: hypothetical protein NC127_03290 [Muribaculum sp.]|nr:hypothetical protein [Muribaculum sp.]
MKYTIFTILLTIAYTAIAGNTLEKLTTNDCLQTETAITDSIVNADMYYYHYNPKTKEETIIGAVPPELLEKIRHTLKMTNGRGIITAYSPSYRDKYLTKHRKDSTTEQFVIDLRDPKMQEILENNPDSLQIKMEEYCAEHGGKL